MGDFIATAIPQVVNGREFFPASPVRRNPNFGTLRMSLQGFHSRYNGVSLGWVKRQSHGLQFQGSYTFGHSWDNRSGSGGRQEFRNGQGRAFDPYHLELDWGRSDYDVRHNLVLDTTYLLPFTGPAVVQGWQVSVVGTFASGVPGRAHGASCDGSDGIGCSSTRGRETVTRDRPTIQD